MKLNVKVKKLHSDAVIPEFKTNGAAGFDLVAIEDVILMPPRISDMKIIHSFEVVGTGLAFEIPQGYELEIRSRSGLAFKNNVYAYNGTIDADYRGEVKLQLTNLSKLPYYISKGDRVAQGIVKQIEQCQFYEVDELSETGRGDGGFGSTGRH